MNIPFVDLKSQYQSIKAEIDSAIAGIIDNTAFIGGRVKEFENAFAEKYGAKHCISCANGTDAIYIALKALGIGSGDEVITVANSWISSSETISQAGARPVFVDIDPEYFHINPELIEAKITQRTKAIIPVHIYGQPCDITKIVELARKYNLYVIEDCAQSHFAEFDGKFTGLFGDIATFSFYPGKNLGAYGDAGGIITNDDKLAEFMRTYANHGALVKHQHTMEGINSRLDGIQAAVLIAKLPYIDKWNSDRRKNADLYDKYLSEISQIQIPKRRPNSKHIFHLYVILAERRDELMQHLSERNIGVGVHYPIALPNMEAYKYLNYTKEDYPIASDYQNKILSLPMFPELTEQQIEYVAQSIKEFYK